MSESSAKVRVAVIDSGAGADATAIELAAGRAFFREDTPFAAGESVDLYDRIGHGATCSRLIRRLAPDAFIIPLRVFGNTLDTSPAVLCAALEYARDHDVDVINLSLSTHREDALVPLFRLCRSLRERGTIVVAAADPIRDPGYPAIFEDVLGVTVVPRKTIVPPSEIDCLECIVGNEHLVPPAFVEDEFSPLSASYATAIVSGVIAARVAVHGRRSLAAIREEILADRRFLSAQSHLSQNSGIASK
jgi:hypothetical protein